MTSDSELCSVRVKLLSIGSSTLRFIIWSRVIACLSIRRSFPGSDYTQAACVGTGLYLRVFYSCDTQAGCVAYADIEQEFTAITFKPELFVDIGATGAMFTLRRTYLHTYYIR